ncbi:MAG TPA: hypothetical protein VLC92_05785 [Rhodocyclaceae bacterium]|nr:hypothetical protein [Rhodocyclaceae bacterium]
MPALLSPGPSCDGYRSPRGAFASASVMRSGFEDVTVSYNYIDDGKKVGLDGHTASAGIADFQRHITYHHNVYYNVNGRLPLQCGGWTHLQQHLRQDHLLRYQRTFGGAYSLIERNWSRTRGTR